MSRGICHLGLIAILLASASGCCSNAWAPWPCGRTWCDCACGEVYWNEWFSHPPDCCDPCSDGACFEGRKTKYVVGCPRNSGIEGRYHDSMAGGEHMDHETYSEPMHPTRRMEPTPAPAEELPPAEPSVRTFYNEFGQQVSFNSASPRLTPIPLQGNLDTPRPLPKRKAPRRR